MFYPADALQCRSMAEEMLRVNDTPELSGRNWLGGIVPHAGWICSGAIAGQTIGTLARQGPVDLVVVFGAIHSRLHTDVAALDTHQRWHVPSGDSQLPSVLSRQLAETPLFTVDARFHQREHAVEVELPLIQLAWPQAAVLPVEVPVVDDAVEIGVLTSQWVARNRLTAIYLASSDLTHYGPNYDFTPVGVGINALQWAKENDQRLLRVVTDMRVESVVPEVRKNWNACGAGAISAMMAACRELGATQGWVLRHANSYETLAGVAPQEPDNAVGYASVLIE
jgi:AmmeMemoRadiSam system protein B